MFSVALQDIFVAILQHPPLISFAPSGVHTMLENLGKVGKLPATFRPPAHH
jgi:hypothetical protein